MFVGVVGKAFGDAGFFLCGVVGFDLEFRNADKERFGVVYVGISLLENTPIEPGVNILQNILCIKNVSALADDEFGN